MAAPVMSWVRVGMKPRWSELAGPCCSRGAPSCGPVHSPRVDRSTASGCSGHAPHFQL